MLRPILLSSLLTLLWTSAVQAQDVVPVYRWVDAEGVPHYSDQPPAGAGVEAVNVRVGRVARSSAARDDDSRYLEQATRMREGQEQAEAADAETERLRVLEERRAGCEQARERAARYANARRLYKPGADGDRQYLSSEEIDAERAAALRAVDEWCSG